jgi:hypothetical protein
MSISSRMLVWLSRPIYLLSVHISRFDMLTPGSDRREHTVHVTQKGREAVSLARPLWQKAQTAVVDTLGQDQLNLLKMLLSQLEEMSI